MNLTSNKGRLTQSKLLGRVRQEGSQEVHDIIHGVGGLEGGLDDMLVREVYPQVGDWVAVHGRQHL